MHTVSVTREIAAPAAAVWAVLDDFGSVANYNPAVEASRIVAGPETGAGATRECVFHDGGRIEETIVDYASGTGYVVEFTDVGEMPLESNVVELDVASVDERRTVVTMTATFRPKYGPLGWLMAKTVMPSRFRATFEAVLEGLASYVHTGETVDAA